MIGQIVSTCENYPLLFLSDTVEAKDASRLVLQQFIHNAPRNFKYVSFEMNLSKNIDLSCVVKEFDRIFPTNDISWISAQLNCDSHFIIFDSLTSFIFRYGLVPTILFLGELLDRKNNILCVIHQDCHTTQDFEKVIHRGNALISVNKTLRNFSIKIFSQKVKSKLIALENAFKIEKGELIMIVEEKKEIEKKEGERKLTDQEEKARANTELPYLKTSDEQIELEEVYIEDPDDDLDI
jgi:hypothetical protein